MPHLTKAYKNRVKTSVPANVKYPRSEILILLHKITSFLSISICLEVIQNLCMDLEVIQGPT